VAVSNKAIIENKRFKEAILDYTIKDGEFFDFKNSSGQTINGWLLNGYNTKEKKKPLLLYVYGGNNKQEVTDKWDDRMAMTFRYFASMGYTVACIDPTGTPGRGEAFRKGTFNDLTNRSIADLADAKNYLANYHDVDANNVTLMGWSYGGFLTTMAATKYSGTFKKYIAIAPVTSWSDYNAAFTERILKTPADNVENYNAFRPGVYINKYVGGLLLVHGSIDQNVHVSHTMRLAKELTESDSYYDIQIFTDKGHALSDGQLDKTRMNLFKKIYKFMQRKETN
jgi:dipeptidyl-peptidase-4